MPMDWIYGLIGGGLIGSAAALLLLGNGKIAGVSGIVSGTLRFKPKRDLSERVLFIAGLIVGPLLVTAGFGKPAIVVTDSVPAVVIGGLLVGFGTRFGNGCTSGHGVCGLSRLSARSMVATATFMIFAAATVAVVRHGFGGF